MWNWQLTQPLGRHNDTEMIFFTQHTVHNNPHNDDRPELVNVWHATRQRPPRTDCSFSFFFCKIFKKNQALTNFLTCVQSLKKTLTQKNKTSNNTTGINKRFVLAKYDPFHSREKTGTDWWLVRHVHVQLCKWRTRWINNTVRVHTLSITMKKKKKSFYRPFKPVGSTSMEKGKAERERLKKRRTKRDTYTFSNSMVLQQALGALRVHVPIKLFCESCEQGVGLEGKKNNAWNFNPLCFFFFFHHTRKFTFSCVFHSFIA